MRKILTFLFVLIATSASGMMHTKELILLLANKVVAVPIVSQNFLSSPTLPVWLDVSSITGNRMVYDTTGKLTQSPNNSQLWSNTFTNIEWSPLGNSTVTQNATDPFGNANTAWTWTATANGAATYLAPASTATGTNSIFAMYAKQGTARYIQISRTGNAFDYVNFDLSDGTFTNFGSAVGSSSLVGGFWLVGARFPGTVPQATGLQFCMVDSKASARFASLTTAGTLTIYNAALSAVIYESTARTADQVATTSAVYYGPRFDYPNAVVEGLLIEETRSNLVRQSNTFNTTWQVSQGSATAASATSPDGTNDGWYIKATSTGTTYGTIFQTVTIPSSTIVTTSVYMKAADYNYGSLAVNDTGGTAYAAVITDLTTGAQTVSSGAGYSSVTSTSQNVGNGWWRITLTSTHSAYTTPQVKIGVSSIASPTFNGYGDAISAITSGLGMYAFGFQVETYPFASSYYPTTTASAARPADLIKLTGAALTAIGGASGTVLEQVNLLGNSAATQYGIYGSGVSPIYLDSTPAFAATNGTTVLPSGVSAVVGTSIRAGLAWAPGASRAISVNGSAAVTDTSAYGTIGSTVYLGSNNGASAINGHYEALSFYNTKLTGSTFTTKTTTGGAL